MKTFLDYLGQTQKTYEYRIRFANADPREKLTILKNAMAAYVVDTMGTPKHLPIMENCIYFPNMKHVDVYVVEVGLKYPVTDNQLRMILAESMQIPLNQVFVSPAGHPEEIWREQAGEIKQYQQGDAELTKPYPDATSDQTAAGKAYADAKVLFKDLPRTTWTQAGSDDTIGGEKNPAHGHTLNQIAFGVESPVGSRQNVIPNPNKSLK